MEIRMGLEDEIHLTREQEAHVIKDLVLLGARRIAIWTAAEAREVPRLEIAVRRQFDQVAQLDLCCTGPQKFPYGVWHQL
jgi:hypothetical protein